MKYYTPNLALLVTALKKVAFNIVKDFNELLYLNSTGASNSSQFAANTLTYLCKKLLDDIGSIKNNYSFYLPNGDVVHNTDTSNYVLINGIAGFQNFKRNFPYFALSLALIRDKKPLASVVCQPLLDQVYVAEVGKAAYLNRRRLKITPPSSNSPLVAATDSKAITGLQDAKVEKLITGCPLLDICALASSNLHLCAYEEPLNYMEILPAVIIAEEAGAKVEFTKNKLTNGEEVFNYLRVSNPVALEVIS